MGDYSFNANLPTFNGIPMISLDKDFSGSTYFVDGNSGSDGGKGHGTSLIKPYKTLAYAAAVSHADIARGSDRWARRNRIYIMGDDFTEDLVALPQKTDIIGLGSSDNYPMACIRGNHAPVDSAVACRFYNVRFRPAASADMWTLASTTGAGLEFWNCLWEAQYSTFTAVSGIDSTACVNWRVMNCEFTGAFSANYIDIGAGAATNVEIAYNKMKGSAVNGIMTTGAVTVSASHYGEIHHNFIACPGIVLDTQASSVFYAYDNVGISAAALGSNSYVIDLTMAARNCLTGNDISVYVPSLTTVAA